MTSRQSTWPVRPFSQVADYAVGKTPARANSAYWERSDDDIPWVSISDLEPYGVVAETKETISRRAFDEVFRRRLVPAGTLLMSFKLTIGRVATLGVPAVHNEAIISIYPRPGVNQRFLGYFLSQYDYADLQDRQIKGNTLNKSKIDRIQVPIPLEIEQRQIADVLDRLRRAIDLQDAVLGNLARTKSVTMQRVFSLGLRGGVQKEADISPIPENWNWVNFDDIREFLQYGTSVPCSLEPRTYPVLRIPNIEPGRVNGAELKYCDLTPETASKYLLEPGDLLFIRTNGVIDRLGSCAVYGGEPKRALFASYLIRARLLDHAHPKFVAYFFGSPLGTELVAGRATPAADGKYNLNTGTIDALPLPLPPTIAEQQEIVDVLDTLDRKIDLHGRKRAVLDQLFKSLLHKLMTGEISVDDLDLSTLPSIDGTAA
ncbi:restriction endonuclease subunit S [Mycobacterium sherrisii]|uniref:restriction endonuclease subunit S n=1 Tax=Mycobacterium sherrisii TaxID=243061 RepID=UPI003974FCE6